MSKFQIHVGFPEMGKKVHKVSIRKRNTGEVLWHEYVPAETPEEAVKKAEEALRELAKENKRYESHRPVVESAFMPRFDGGEGPINWRRSGFSGEIPDQYVAACDKGGINLHIFAIGKYKGCYGCWKREACYETAITAAEQAEP